MLHLRKQHLLTAAAAGAAGVVVPIPAAGQAVTAAVAATWHAPGPDGPSSAAVDMATLEVSMWYKVAASAVAAAVAAGVGVLLVVVVAQGQGPAAAVA